MTAPLVPAYVNLRMIAKMPLSVQRLRDSALASTHSPEAFRSSILLFCSSWHQVPAGSLPNDEKELAKLAGFGRSLREFRKVSNETLRNWVLCEDGRLYHPVVAEEALSAWRAHLKHAWRSECERLKKASVRGKLAAKYPKFCDWVARYQNGGGPRWDDLLVPGDIPGDVPWESSESPTAVPGDGEVRREGKGREGSSNSSIDTSERAGRSLSLANDLARAAVMIGFEACSARAPEIIRASEAGISVDELRHAAIGMAPGKPLAWLIARAIGKRGDAHNLGHHVVGRGPPGDAADPAVARAAAENHERDRERSVIEGDLEKGLFSQDETRALLEALRDDGVAGVRKLRHDFRVVGGLS